jgi:hypothetical protein
MRPSPDAINIEFAPPFRASTLPGGQMPSPMTIQRMHAFATAIGRPQGLHARRDLGRGLGGRLRSTGTPGIPDPIDSTRGGPTLADSVIQPMGLGTSFVQEGGLQGGPGSGAADFWQDRQQATPERSPSLAAAYSSSEQDNDESSGGEEILGGQGIRDLYGDDSWEKIHCTFSPPPCDFTGDGPCTRENFDRMPSYLQFFEMFWPSGRRFLVPRYGDGVACVHVHQLVYGHAMATKHEDLLVEVGATLSL